MGHDSLLALHFFGLFMGGAAGLGLPVIGATLAATPVEHRAPLARVAGILKRIGQAGMALLIVTGVVLSGMGDVWSEGLLLFWIKLLAVAVMVAGMVRADRLGPRAMSGDAAAAGAVRTIGLVNLVALAVVVVAASFAFL